MIIDCHGHYTTTPRAHQEFRDAQLAWLADTSRPVPTRSLISTDEIKESIEFHQLALMHERGIDLTIFSPKASGMEHHITDSGTAVAWAQASNDLVAEVEACFPRHFASVCQLPQTPNGSLADSVVELRRCVETMGFVGCNLNPDPSGGFWTAPPLTDEFWFPLFEAMVELDVPGMVHVSSSCNPAINTLGAHYLNADTSVFMQLLQGDLFERFPTLRLVIPHGGGAVPYHWGRYRGLAARMGCADPSELLRNVYFDTCVYHQLGVDLLLDVVPPANVLFASEALGAVRGADPDTGVAWDDTKQYVESARLTVENRHGVFEGNARRVYPRLDARLKARTG